MSKKLLSLSQLTKIKAQKEYLIKVAFVAFIALITFVALFFELQFRKAVVLEGSIRICFYEGFDVLCNYLETSNGNSLLTQGTIDKFHQTNPTVSIYDKKVQLTGRVSRQKLAIENLGKMRRFQIEKLEFLEP